jgi:hypothetical protein
MPDRRDVLRGLFAVAPLLALGSQRAMAETVSCNSNEKCEAKCGTEHALCCNGRCILAGCGPDRNLNLRRCQCERRTRRGKVRVTPPKYCGA